MAFMMRAMLGIRLALGFGGKLEAQIKLDSFQNRPYFKSNPANFLDANWNPNPNPNQTPQTRTHCEVEKEKPIVLGMEAMGEGSSPYVL